MWLIGSLVAMLALASSAIAANADAQVIKVFDSAPIRWDKDQPDDVSADGYAIKDHGRMVERAVDLPALPRNQRDARRIMLRAEVEPELVRSDTGRMEPGDFWTRMGSITIIRPAPSSDPAVGKSLPATQPANNKSAKDKPAGDATSEPRPIEIMRFITGFGGEAVFEQDVTALAPLLTGRTTIQATISTYRNPAWRITLTLTYSSDDAGYRRPMFARGVLFENTVTAENNIVKGTVTIPAGVAQPRMFILSTGHATDGTEGDEFVTRTNILRIDKKEVSRWRPWAEDGGAQRSGNPTSGRKQVDGRWVWSSDLDRSGWHPGLVVKPVKIPLPELTPGRHEIELEIVGIRPMDADGNHGYWRVSGIVVADEPWPED